MDILFAKLEKEHPDHFAVKQYRKFKLAAGVTYYRRLLENPYFSRKTALVVT